MAIMSENESMAEAKIYREERSINICNVVGICPTTRAEFVEKLYTIPRTPVSATIALVGIPAIVTAKSDPRYAQMYNAATMTAIDGMPFVKKARRKGFSCERCSGPDIMEPVFREGIPRGTTHYFYGGKNDEVLSRLRTNLETDFPGIRIVGMYSPPFRPLTEEEDRAIVEEINSLSPDFLWVGIGAPKQEMWMLEHRDRINGTCMLGVGAAFDFLAGTLSKAPSWVENAGLEWAFRLSKEPKRLWRRYLLGGMKYGWYSMTAAISNLLQHKSN